jgi:hypothetical protein
MTKPVFTAALKRAQTLNGGYPITPNERDIFYEAFKDEPDEDVLYALDMVGKGKERISYHLIQGYIQMHRSERMRDSGYKEPKDKVPMPQSFKDAWKKLTGKRW